MASDKWPDFSLHHGHGKAVFGCEDCADVARGWVCVCGVPNKKREICIRCGDDVSSTRKMCLCDHSRAKHERYTGECSACSCKEYQSKTEPRQRGDAVQPTAGNPVG
jgi:hypothetical protein